MANKYLMKVGLDFDDLELDRVAGIISDELTSMGEISKKFTDNALDTARKYNDEINKQKNLIEDINKQLQRGDLSAGQRSFLELTRRKAEDRKTRYEKGYVDEAGKAHLSNKEVQKIADISKGARSEDDGPSLSSTLSMFTKGVALVAAGFNTASATIKAFVAKVDSAMDDFSEAANNLDPLGAFGSQKHRDLMTRYGLTGSQAWGFSQVLEAMGLSEADIGRMTAEQRQAFNNLNSYWNNLIGQLSSEDLERYTNTMAKYQEVVAKYDMGIQATILKLVSSSPSFERLVGKAEDFMESTLEFLGSPLVQAVFDGLIDFLTTAMSILANVMKLGSSISGGSTVNNNNVTSNNNFNIYGSNYQDNAELARQISYASQSSYRG